MSDIKEVKHKQIENQVYIDSKICTYTDKLKLFFDQEIKVMNIYIKDFFLNHVDTNLDLNKIKFLVLRIVELGQHRNNAVYNTSRLHPDSDIILYKSSIQPENVQFEARSVIHLDEILYTTSLTFQILDDEGHVLDSSILGDFFINLNLTITKTYL